VRDHSTNAAYPRAWTGRPRAPSYLALLRSGFTEPIRSPGSLVVSCTTVSPLPVPEGHRRSALCCTFPGVAPAGISPVICPMESGLSSESRSERIILRGPLALSSWSQCACSHTDDSSIQHPALCKIENSDECVYAECGRNADRRAWSRTERQHPRQQ